MKTIREIKRLNLLRILEEERMKPADLARRYKGGTSSPQNINSFLKKGFKDDVVEDLAAAVGRSWYEFYRIDEDVNAPGIPNDIATAMNDLKEILLLAKQTGDDWYEKVVREILVFLREGVQRNMDRKNLGDQLAGLVSEMNKIKRHIGLPVDSGQLPTTKPLARKGAQTVF
jgi:hypothetical protein